MSVGLVDATVSNDSNTFQDIPVTYGAGNAFLVGVTYNNSAVTVTITDSQSNTYTEIGSAETDGAFVTTHLFRASGVTGSSATMTVTFSSSRHATVSITEWSGVDSGSPIGGTAGGVNTSSGDILSGSLSAAGVAGDVVAAFAGNFYQSTFAVGATNPSGFAIESTASLQRSDSTGSIGMGYAALAAGYSGAASLDPSGTTYGSIKVAVLKAAAVAQVSMDQWYAKTPDVIRRQIGAVPSGTIGIKARAWVRRDRIFVPAWLGEAA
jgi:hypothetical protein